MLGLCVAAIHIYSGSEDTTNHATFIVHKISNNTAYAKENSFMEICSKQGLNSDLFDRKLACYLLVRPPLLADR